MVVDKTTDLVNCNINSYKQLLYIVYIKLNLWGYLNSEGTYSGSCEKEHDGIYYSNF